MNFIYNAMRLCQAYGITLLCFDYYIGDSPARAFEAGNQINGNYPCSCGTDIRCAMHCSSLGRPKFVALQDRQDVIEKTERWNKRKDGELSVYDNLDVSRHPYSHRSASIYM